LKFFRSSRGKVVTGIVLVLILFLVRPGAQRLKTRIVRSISLALGRQVDVGSVSLRFLPQPGFELGTFVVHDDPAFGAEPVLQAAQVVASIRVFSLFRGHLEISRLSLSEPSLNLVRNHEGHWNLEDVLERAAKVPVAPTSKARTERRPGFPYIEAGHGRINLKFGQEKKPYSLTDANFALWQDTENTWGVRLKGQPMRTDFNLSDTGRLEVDGSWQRAANLHQTPLEFTLQWDGAQLGQATKLTVGQDKGWRGGVALSATVTGTPEDLIVAADALVQNFHRYDIATDKSLQLATHCTGHYSSVDHVFTRVACRTPVGEGAVAVNGNVAWLSGARSYDLNLLVENVSIQPVVEFARRMKKNIPADVVATGKLEANLAIRRETTDELPIWKGRGEVTGLNLRSSVNNTRLTLDKVPFVLSSGVDSASSPARRFRVAPLLVEPRLDVGPFSVALGRPENATVHAQLSRDGYNLAVQGDAELQRLLDAGRTVGLSTLQLAASGETHVNLHVAGSWAGFAAPVFTGTALLNSVHARVRGLNDPVEVTSASLLLSPGTTDVQKLILVAAGTTLRGSLTVPRQSDTTGDYPIRFDLHAEEIATNKLGEAAAGSGKQPWYRFLSSSPQAAPKASSPGTSSSFLASVHAVGKLSAGRVRVHDVVANRVSADVELEQGHLHLSKLRGEAIGGRHSGEWTVDFNTSPPTYSGNGSLSNVSLEQLADAMHDGWVTGAANIEYRANTLGWDKQELMSAAAVTLSVDAHDSSLPHLILAGEASPLRVNHFVGRLRLRDGKIEVEEGTLQTAASIYQLSGSASLSRVLDMKLAREGAHSFSITGTLTQPHVVANTTAETQAALKP